MRHFLSLTFLYVASLLSLSALQPLNHQVLEESQRIFANTQKTCYQHNAYIDESQGVYELDCSQLVEFIIKKVQPNALVSIPIVTKMNRLQSAGLYEAILYDSTHWKVISNLMDAQPGDIIAWRNKEIQPNRNTGHIVIVTEPPVPLDNNIISVRILDATSSRHDNDTRPPKTNGVGQGTIRFQVDSSGSPSGLYWSSRQSEPKYKAIAIGRLQSP